MIVNRKVVSYSVDKETIKKFNELTTKLGSNKSRVIQLLMENWVKENEKE